MESTPVRRRLDLCAHRQAGGGDEFLVLRLVDDSHGDVIEAQGLCTLPAPNDLLGDRGITVEQFLRHWRQGEAWLDAEARHYGRLLYRHLFERSHTISHDWALAMQAASSCGLRLEIRFPEPDAAHWCGQSITALPFELLCDDRGFLFRRPGWSAVRRPSRQRLRPLRLHREQTRTPRVQVAWANVAHDGGAPLDEALFSGHDQAVQRLDARGRATRLAPLPQATRRGLADALATEKPHVLLWVGHGLSVGGGLLLHDRDHARFPADPGKEVSAADFACDVRGGEVDLALLWSCHGAGGFGALQAGVAEALLDPEYGNVAAVLASFTAVEAPAVAELSAELIDAWAASLDGDLEVALARARSRMDERSLTWARPILFLRTAAATLGAPPPTVPPMPGSVGHGLRWLPQLPARSEHYVDHQQRLAALEQDLDHHAVVVLEGLPGVGKTELALATAHRRRAAGEDVAFIDVTGHRDISLLQLTLGQLVRKEPFERREELLGALQGRRWTLILDNAEDLLHSAAGREDLLALIAGLQATGPGFRAVVTSRHALAVPGSAAAAGLFVREQLALTLDEARELFVAVVGLRLAPAQATPTVLDPLLRELGGIARAVVLMAGQLGGAVDVMELRRRLAKEGAQAIVEAEQFGVPVSEALDVALDKRRLVSALNLSLKSAAARVPECLDLFDALGAFPAGVTQELLPHEKFFWLTDALGTLLEHHLVSLSTALRRIVMAAPVRMLALQRWKDRGEDKKEAGELMLALNSGLEKKIQEISEKENFLDFSSIVDDLPNFIFAMEMLEGNIGGSQNSYGIEDIRFLIAKMAIAAGDKLNNQKEVNFLIGKALKFQTMYSKKHSEIYQSAINVYRQINSNINNEMELNRISSMLRKIESDVMRSKDQPLLEASQDKYSSSKKSKSKERRFFGALKKYAATLPLYWRIRGRLVRAKINTNRLKNHRGAKQDSKQRINPLALESAFDRYQKIRELRQEANGLHARGDYAAALWLYRQIEDRLGEANTLKALGDLQLRRSDLAGASSSYAAALWLYRQIEDRLGEANTLQALGDLQLRTSDLAGAAASYAAALPLYRQIENRLGEANTLQALGDLQLRTSDLAGAAASYAAALPLFRQIEARQGEANTLKGLGDLQLRRSDLAGAAVAYAAALPLFRQSGARHGEANTLQALGDLQRRTDDLSGAAASYAAALRLYRQIEDRLGEANTLRALGDLQLRRSDLAGATASYAAALPLYRWIRDRLGEANTLQALGQLSLAQGAPVAAFAQMLQALQLQQTLDNQSGVGAAHGYLARVAASVGALPQMIGLSGRAVRIFIDTHDRFGQLLTLDTLGRAMLPQATTQGLACLLQAQAIAGEIGDPAAEAIGRLLASLRAKGVDDVAFVEAIAELRTQAKAMVEAMFAEAEAAVERGELDLYALLDDIVSAAEGDAEGADDR